MNLCDSVECGGLRKAKLITCRPEKTNISPLNGDTTMDNETANDRRSKVGRLIHTYNLNGMAETLEARWTGDGETQSSLRELADYFNRQLLRETMIEAGMDPLQGEVENTYRLLTDDVSAGVHTQTRKHLEREGVDVEQIKRDFVSHQAIHTYLTKYRGVEKEEEGTDEDQVEKALQTVQRLKNRLSAVTNNTLETLQRTNRISLGDFNVSVDVRVFCHDCGEQYDVRDLLTAGHCGCKNEQETNAS